MRRRLFGDRHVRRHGDPSGLAVAERAHERGKVRAAEPSGLCDVRLNFVFHGSPHDAGLAAEALAARLLLIEQVLTADWSVSERAAP